MLQKLGNTGSPLDEKKGEARVFKDVCVDLFYAIWPFTILIIDIFIKDVAELMTATRAIVLRLEDRQRRGESTPSDA